MREKSLTIKGVDWRYVAGGSGERALLLFQGAHGGVESAKALAEGFAAECRVVAPALAPVRSLDAVCDAASAMLDKEHIARATVFGEGFGGHLAQAFLKRRRAQSENLILLSASAPDRAEGEREARALKYLRLMPFRLMRALMRAEMSKRMDATGDDENAAGEVDAAGDDAREASARRRALGEDFNRALTKEMLLARAALSVEFNAREAYSPSDYDDWPGRVLLIDSNDAAPEAISRRRRLREAHPRALVCTFEGARRGSPRLRADELVEVVRAFVKEDYKRPSDIDDYCPADGEHAHDGAHVHAHDGAHDG